MNRFAILLLCGAATASSAQTPQDVLKTSAAKLQAASSLTCTMTVTFPNGKPQTWNVQFLKPNLYRIVTPDQEFHSDGKAESSYIPASKQYDYTDRKGTAIVDAPFALGLNGFFSGALAGNGVAGESASLSGVPVYEIQIQEPGLSGLTNLFFDSQTDLPLGYDEPMAGGQILSVRYENLALSAPLNLTTFAWMPPRGAHPLQPKDLGSKMIQPGQLAPTPAVTGPDGKSVDLGSDFTSHRATLLYFWPANPPLPDDASLRQLATSLSSQRLEIIVVVEANPSSQKLKLLAGAPFDVVVDSSGQLFKAYGVQTQTAVVVGPDAKVGGSFVGYDADGIAKALRLRGFRI